MVFHVTQFPMSLSHTDILLSDGVGPPVVSKHLIGQADHTMPFNIANLGEFGPTATADICTHQHLLSVPLQPLWYWCTPVQASASEHLARPGTLRLCRCTNTRVQAITLEYSKYFHEKWPSGFCLPVRKTWLQSCYCPRRYSTFLLLVNNRCSLKTPHPSEGLALDLPKES